MKAHIPAAECCRHRVRQGGVPLTKSSKGTREPRCERREGLQPCCFWGNVGQPASSHCDAWPFFALSARESAPAVASGVCTATPDASPPHSPLPPSTLSCRPCPADADVNARCALSSPATLRLQRQWRHRLLDERSFSSAICPSSGARFPRTACIRVIAEPSSRRVHSNHRRAPVTCLSWPTVLARRPS